MRDQFYNWLGAVTLGWLTAMGLGVALRRFVEVPEWLGVVFFIGAVMVYRLIIPTTLGKLVALRRRRGDPPDTSTARPNGSQR